MSYQDFIRSKHVRVGEVGFAPGEMHNSLFDWQRAIVEWACRKGRAALFEDCGLGKTRQQLEWARQVVNHTGRPVLIVAPLAVGAQTVAEGMEIDLPVTQVRGQQEVTSPGVYVTNYEMVEHFNPRGFGGVVLDESSILKAFIGKTKRLLVEMFSCVPYRIACTATPAPNDLCELGNHSEFLGLFSLQEMQSRWFVNDGFDAGSYRLKKHAAHDFWQWVGSWAVCIQTPDDLGFDGSAFVLPPLVTHRHVVAVDEFKEGQGTLVNMQKLSATALHQELRETAPQRAEKVASLCSQSSDPWVVWCHTDAEADEIMKRIPGAVEVRGSMPFQRKSDNLMAFSSGECRVIVTKPKIAGWGLNWQHCANIATVGPSYSFESRYQAIRRCWRFGQKRQVEDHVVMTRRESAVFEVAQTKEIQHRSMADAMREVGHDLSVARRRELKEYRPIQQILLPSFIRSNSHAM